MSTTDSPTTYGAYHWVVKITGLESVTNWYNCTPPSATIDAPEFKVWANNGDPVNSLTGGKQVTWAPVTLSRGGDDNKDLWTWFKDVMEKGATADTKKEVTLECKAHGDDKTLFTWTLHGAVIVSYSYGGGSAQTQEVLVTNIQLKYESAELS